MLLYQKHGIDMEPKEMPSIPDVNSKMFHDGFLSLNIPLHNYLPAAISDAYNYQNRSKAIS